MKKVLVVLAVFAAAGAAVAYYRHKFLEYFTPVVDDPTHDEDVEAVPGDPYQPRTLRGYGRARRTTGGYADIRQEDLDG